MKHLSRALVALIAGLLVSAGCAPPQVVGDTPESRMNPAMTAHQKALRSGAAPNAGG